MQEKNWKGGVCYTSRGMKRTLPILLDTLHDVALALWLGGVVLFWMLATSGALQVRNVPLEAVNAVLGAAWGVLGLWAERCGLVMIGVQFVLRRRFQRHRPSFVADGVRQLLTFGALLLTEYAYRGTTHRAILYSHTVPGGTVTAPDAALMGLCVAQIVLLIGVMALTIRLRPLTALVAAPAAPAPTVTPATPPPNRPTAAPPRQRREMSGHSRGRKSG